MARTDITPIEIDRLSPSLNAAALTPDAVNGNSFSNAGQRVFLRVKNNSGSPVNVTVTLPSQVEEEQVPDKIETVPAGQELFWGPFPTDYETTDNGLTRRILVDWSASTNIQFNVFKLSQV